MHDILLSCVRVMCIYMCVAYVMLCAVSLRLCWLYLSAGLSSGFISNTLYVVGGADESGECVIRTHDGMHDCYDGHKTSMSYDAKQPQTCVTSGNNNTRNSNKQQTVSSTKNN